jgi:hypothetical protein
MWLGNKVLINCWPSGKLAKNNVSWFDHFLKTWFLQVPKFVYSTFGYKIHHCHLLAFLPLNSRRGILHMVQGFSKTAVITLSPIGKKWRHF